MYRSLRRYASSNKDVVAREDDERDVVIGAHNLVMAVVTRGIPCRAPVLNDLSYSLSSMPTSLSSTLCPQPDDGSGDLGWPYGPTDCVVAPADVA